jgi:hypothetical protein
VSRYSSCVVCGWLSVYCLNAFEVQIAVEKFKRYTSPGTDRISAKLIPSGGKRICSEIEKVCLLPFWCCVQQQADTVEYRPMTLSKRNEPYIWTLPTHISISVQSPINQIDRRKPTHGSIIRNRRRIKHVLFKCYTMYEF